MDGLRIRVTSPTTTTRGVALDWVVIRAMPPIWRVVRVRPVLRFLFLRFLFWLLHCDLKYRPAVRHYGQPHNGGTCRPANRASFCAGFESLSGKSETPSCN